MDKKDVIHIAAEVTVFGALVAYVVNQNAALRKEIEVLREEIQVVAKKQDRSSKHAASELSKVVHAFSQHRVRQPPQPQQPQPARRVRFQEDELLEAEFAESSEEVYPEEGEFYESEEEEEEKFRPRAPRKKDGPTRGILKGGIKHPRASGMEDVAARAAHLKRMAEERARE